MVGRRISRGDRMLEAVNVALMLLLTFLFFYPLWETVVRSLSTPETASSLGVKLWPSAWTTDAYRHVLANPDFLLGFRNTLFRTLAGTGLAVTITYSGGYGLSRRDLPGKTFITFYIVLTMFLGAGLIPTYMNIRGLGLLDTYWALILPLATSAWNLVICRNFIAALPYDLEESAMIDGAHPLRIVFQIVLPLSAPILAVLALWSAVGHWNAWFDAMIYTPKPEMTVLQLVVRRMIVTSQDESNILSAAQADITSTTIKSATIVVATLPITIVYPFLQKFFVKGVMVGAIKG